VTHFHAQYGIPGYGLAWTDDAHDTARDAWEAVSHVLRENWQQDKATVQGSPRLYGHVGAGYSRGAALCITLEVPGRFHIPSLSTDDPGLTYGVVSCDSVHLKVA
jgi:hypothetical protein